MTMTSRGILLGTTLLLAGVSACQADYASQGHQGEPCRIDADCQGALSCIAFACVVPGDPDDIGIRDTGDRPDGDDRRDTTGDTDPRPGVPRPDIGPDVPLPDAGDICTPGERLCRDDRTTWLCRPDGSGYLSRRCNSGEGCRNGECTTDVPPVCEASARRCQGSVVQRCRVDGQRWESVEDCSDIDAACTNGACQSDTAQLNITVLDVQVDGGGLSPGRTDLRLSAGIANTGRASVGPVECSAWLSRDTRLDPSRDFQVWAEVEQLDVGSSSRFFTEATIGNLPAGSYTLILECDVLAQRWLEFDETDNLAVSPNTIAVLDNSSECVEDDFEGVNFPLLDPGGYVLGLCRDDVDTFQFDNPTDGGWFRGFASPFVPGTLWSVSVYGLDTGELYFDEPSDGPFPIELFLPRGRFAIEFRRDTGPTNYDFQFELEGVVTNDRADLVPEVLNAFPEGPLPEAPITGDYVIVNNGQRASGETEVLLRLSADRRPSSDDAIIWRDRLPPMGPGEGVGFGFQALVDPSVADGVYWLLLTVDEPNFVQESNESNNTLVGPQLEVQRSTPTNCSDRLEPNDSLDRARDTAAGYYDQLVVCEANRDFYRVCLGDNQRLTVDLSFRHSLGDIDVNILDNSLDAITGSYGVDNFEHTEAETGRATCYTVEVYLCCGGGSNAYTMDLNIIDIPPEEQCTLTFEPNDDRSQATSLQTALPHDDLALCPRFDTDVYFLDVTAGQTLNVSAINQSNDGSQMQMAVYTGNDYIGDSFGANPSITFRAPQTTRTFIELRRTDDTQRAVRYRLNLTRF